MNLKLNLLKSLIDLKDNIDNR